jgi:hypothetical protein
MRTNPGPPAREPTMNNGHAVYEAGYDHIGVTVLTWGNTQRVTGAWWDEGVDKAYAILPPEAKQSGCALCFNCA